MKSQSYFHQLLIFITHCHKSIFFFTVHLIFGFPCGHLPRSNVIMSTVLNHLLRCDKFMSSLQEGFSSRLFKILSKLYAFFKPNHLLYSYETWCTSSCVLRAPDSELSTIIYLDVYLINNLFKYLIFKYYIFLTFQASWDPPGLGRRMIASGLSALTKAEGIQSRNTVEGN